MNINSFDIQSELKNVPEKPGVYIMKDEAGEIIYVGKAVVLKNRLRQYFQSLSGQTPKVQAMVPRIKRFEYIVTDSELEALILECNLIKKHKPRFNILLKDDKSYPYIKITLNEEYPRILMTRRFEQDGARYFGPYTNAGAVKQTIDLLKKIFPIKTCAKVLPRDIGKDRPCLNYHIYQCLAPCRGDVDSGEYRALMMDICSFLEGRQQEILRRLEKDMADAAKGLEFEKAASIRNKIISLKHISEKQKVISSALEDQDVIAFAKGPQDACIQVFFIRGGKLIGREHFLLDSPDMEEDSELMASFVKQFYTSAAFVPGEIILQNDIDELNLIEKWLSDKRGSRVYIKVPRRGEKLRLVEMVAQNALAALHQYRERIAKESETSQKALQELAVILGLKEPPKRVEAYDISNTGKTEIVGSMVVFAGGKPCKSDYRRFKIKSNKQQDDYAAMQEMLFRRLKYIKRKENEPDSSFNHKPDLILIDGGTGHAAAVKDVMEQLEMDIPVCGMVKDASHRTRGLVFEGKEYPLAEAPHVLRLVSAIQDEAHRFALEYNRRLRSKRYKSSVLDEIEGVGYKRRKALLSHFGSVKKVRDASVEELQKVQGISRGVAENICSYFRK
jgi:excinuclease ABC subunit C